tara:strand:- start:573 stop:722 length:150 start_codon:yes stop_codon:yes gene_type:complete
MALSSRLEANPCACSKEQTSSLPFFQVEPPARLETHLPWKGKTQTPQAL